MSFHISCRVLNYLINAQCGFQVVQVYTLQLTAWHINMTPLDIYPKTYFGHFEKISTYDDSRAI